MDNEHVWERKFDAQDKLDYEDAGLLTPRKPPPPGRQLAKSASFGSSWFTSGMMQQALGRLDRVLKNLPVYIHKRDDGGRLWSCMRCETQIYHRGQPPGHLEGRVVSCFDKCVEQVIET